MRTTILLLTVALVVSAIPCHSQIAVDRKSDEKSDESIRLSTELVALDVQIVDRKTQRVVNSLSRNDFEIYEDGVKQQIDQFSQDTLPLSVVLLLDASASMWTLLESLRANALRALGSLKPEDEVALVVTADETVLVRDFTKEKFLIADDLRELDFTKFGDDGILLHDSIYRAASHLLKAANPANRRVIIAVTDNETIPTEHWKAFQKDEGVSLVLETGAVVCGLVLKRHVAMRTASKLLGFSPWQGGGDIRNYAEISGGEVLVSNNETVAEKLIKLIENLRARYSLAFVPSNSKRDGKFRRLKVRLASELEQQLRNAGTNLVISTRSGYYAAKK